MKAKVFHHNDNDGYFTAALFMLGHQGEPNITYDYTRTVSGRGRELGDLSEYRRVIFLDLFPTEEEIAYLNTLPVTVYIYDHHASNQALADRLRMNRKYFILFDAEAPGATGLIYREEYDLLPGVVKTPEAKALVAAVGATDSRRWNYLDSFEAEFTEIGLPNSRATALVLAAALNGKVNTPAAAVEQLKTAAPNELYHEQMKVIDILQPFYDQIAAKGYVRQWEGLSVFVLNHSVSYYGIVEKQCTRLEEKGVHIDVALFWSYNPQQKTINVTMYDIFERNSYNLGAIATKYRGGGHKSAAGFYTDWDSFPIELR